MGVKHTSSNPKFDAHMKKFDKKNMTPSKRIEHLLKGAAIRKASKKTINNVNTA